MKFETAITFAKDVINICGKHPEVVKSAKTAFRVPENIFNYISKCTDLLHIYAGAICVVAIACSKFCKFMAKITHGKTF